MLFNIQYFDQYLVFHHNFFIDIQSFHQLNYYSSPGCLTLGYFSCLVFRGTGIFLASSTASMAVDKKRKSLKMRSSHTHIIRKLHLRLYPWTAWIETGTTTGSGTIVSSSFFTVNPPLPSSMIWMAAATSSKSVWPSIDNKSFGNAAGWADRRWIFQWRFRSPRTRNFLSQYSHWCGFSPEVLKIDNLFINRIYRCKENAYTQTCVNAPMIL